MGYVSELRALIGKRPLILVGANIIIFDSGNRMLLQRRTDNNTWGIIGGALEVGETLEETAKREAFEETGLVVENLKLFDIFSGPDFFYEYPNGDQVYDVCVVYIVKSFTGEIRTDDKEGHALKFFHLDHLPANINQPDKPIIEKLLLSVKLRK
jgi:8-oxo-dGTP pyrophosphatase MutT (NUDIX family)